LHSNRKVILDLAFYTALAVSIFTLENLLPRPLPFLKFGLANIIVLYVLITRDLLSALLVTVFKTLFGGLFSGLLISPATLLSISGSLTALFVMAGLLGSGINFSLIGISISGAVFHNLTQLAVVRFILIEDNSIFYLAPLLILLGLATGIITGYLTYLLIKHSQRITYEKTDH